MSHCRTNLVRRPVWMLSIALLCAQPAASQPALRIAGTANAPETATAAAVLEEAYRRIGAEIEFVWFPETAGVVAASGRADGELQRIDGLASGFPSLLQVDIPVNFVELGVLSREDRPPVVGWDSLQGLVVGYVGGSRFEQLGDYGLVGRAAPDYESVFAMLEGGQVDVAVMPLISGRVLIDRHQPTTIRELGGVLELLFLYHYVDQTHASLVPLLQRTLRAMLLEGTTRTIRERVAAQLLPRKRPVLGAVPELSADKEPGEKTRRVKTRGQSVGSSGVKPADAPDEAALLRIAGFGEGSPEALTATSVLREAYARIGVSVDFVWLSPVETLPTANSGSVDGELQRIDGLSRVYPNLREVGIPVNFVEIATLSRDVRPPVTGWDDLLPYTVGYVGGTALMAEVLAGFDSIGAPDEEALFGLLEDGGIDVAVIPRGQARLLLREHSPTVVHELDGTLETNFLYHYLHRDHLDLLPRLEQELRSMLLDGTIRRIWERGLDEVLR